MVYGFFSPSSDLIDIQVALEDSVMDSFVFALTYSMEGREMIKDLKDIKELTKSNKVESLNNQFLVHSEFKGNTYFKFIFNNYSNLFDEDATSTILKDTVKATLNKYKEFIRLIYITDQSIQSTR